MYIVHKCKRWPNYIAISKVYISKTLLQSLTRCDDKRPYHGMESQNDVCSRRPSCIQAQQRCEQIKICRYKRQTIGKATICGDLTGDQVFLPAKTIHDAFFGIQNNINDKASIQISNHKIKACTLTIFTISPQLRLKHLRSSFSKR